MNRTCVPALALLCACASAEPFEGLARANDTGGPRVVFDPTQRQLGEIPFPNDVAARPDGTTPTGLRVNLSLTAPTQLERRVRALVDALDGFGTFQPITVAFDQDLDVLDLYARQNDADATNDAVYLVDLATGGTVPLDVGGGRYPLALPDATAAYFPSDPLAGVRNLFFPVDGPAANFFHPERPHATPREQVDDLLTFYERSTRTLIVRPAVPLAQGRRYAVVLTNRLLGADGRAIRSPHSGINHATQTKALQPLLSHLPPGTQLGDVAYTWAFTTQSITRDLEAIRSGLYAEGALRVLALQHAVQTGTSFGTGDVAYRTLMQVLQSRGVPHDANNPDPDLTDFILPSDQLAALLNDPQIVALLPLGGPAERQALIDTWKYVAYFVSGIFESPDFIGATARDTQERSFRIDLTTGTAGAVGARIPFFLAVPKERPEVGHMQPFPTVIAGHGYGSTRLQQVLGFAGTFAKFGLATASIDAFGHGLALDPVSEALVRSVADQKGLGQFADAILRGRARDLDNDGIADPGGDFWNADGIHTRDTIRQSIVDWVQLVRVLRSFDGHGTMTLGADPNAVAGDFNNDGIPDLGGAPTFPYDVPSPDPKLPPLFRQNERNPGGDTFVFGISLGGILSAILPAIEPAIVAAAPVSGGGGLSDVALRTSLTPVIDAVWLEVMGPFVTTCKWSPTSGPVDPQTNLRFGACNPAAADAADMLVLVVQDLTRERDVPIVPLALQPGDRVTVKNLAQATATVDCSAAPGADGCSTAVAGPTGTIRVPVAADGPSLRATRTDRTPPDVDVVAVEVLRPGDGLQIAISSGAQTTTIDTFGVSTRVNGVTYDAGAPLVSPARGYGLSRNTPDFRRLVALTQMMLDGGDPIDFAPHWFKDPVRARSGSPANVLVVGTIGDPAVPVQTAISLARAAGIVDLTTPDPDYLLTPDQILIRSGAVEGIANLRRFEDPASGPRALLDGRVSCAEPRACTGDVLADVAAYGCNASGANCLDVFGGGTGAPRLTPPLRQQLVVQSSPPLATCPVSSRAQQASGCWSTGPSKCATTAGGGAAAGISALMLPYLDRTGQHGFAGPQPQKAFDMDQFMANAIGRYFECRGRELQFDRCQQKLSSASPGGCAWIPPPPP